MNGNHCGMLGVVGIGVSLLALVTLHFLDPDLSVVDEYISVYALGDYGWLERAAETTTAGAIHDIAGHVSILGLVISSWMLRGVFARDDGYKDLARTQLWFAVLMSVALAAVLALFEVSVGLPQRAFVVVTLSWLVVLAVSPRRGDKSGHAI